LADVRLANDWFMNDRLAQDRWAHYWLTYICPNYYWWANTCYTSDTTHAQRLTYAYERRLLSHERGLLSNQT
jgi:hypothetical protein